MPICCSWKRAMSGGNGGPTRWDSMFPTPSVTAYSPQVTIQLLPLKWRLRKPFLLLRHKPMLWKTWAKLLELFKKLYVYKPSLFTRSLPLLWKYLLVLGEAFWFVAVLRTNSSQKIVLKDASSLKMHTCYCCLSPQSRIWNGLFYEVYPAIAPLCAEACY